MPTALISHPACSEHDMGAGHPEQPARVDAIADRLRASGAMDFLRQEKAPAASRSQLERVHAAAYLDALATVAPDSGLVHIDADTIMGAGTWEAALRSAGACVHATDLVLAGKAERAFCNTRPPGHHAEHDRAMGFCFFNNIAVGAAHALDKHGLERVAIIDFDVHFGNGTADIARRDDRMLLLSSYQHPLYPGMNPPNRKGQEINCPLPAGSGGDALREVCTQHWLPELDAFQPQMLLLSAGFDAAAGDPLAGLQFTRGDFAWLTAELCAWADRHCQGRVVSTLEGGYDLDSLAACAGAHINALMAG